jgi:Arc/MetJ-type ribon-helix-helix transcriptional regulator
LHKLQMLTEICSMFMEVVDMVRSRVFCTIKEDIVAWVDKQVNDARFRNRSHAIEYALIKLREADEKRQQDK